MVKKSILDGNVTEWIKRISVEKLHELDSIKLIKIVCGQVIECIESWKLVQIIPNDVFLKAEKLKNKPQRIVEWIIGLQNNPNPDIQLRLSQQFRVDFRMENFIPDEIGFKGYIFRDNDTVLGLIYVNLSSPSDEFIFLDKDLANNPILAQNLILALSKKYKKVWRKTHPV